MTASRRPYLDVVLDPKFRLMGFSLADLRTLKRYLDTKALTVADLEKELRGSQA